MAPEDGRTEEWVNNTSQSVHEPSAQNMCDEIDTQVTGEETVVTQIECQQTSEVVTDYESVFSSAPRDQQYPVSSRLSVHSAPTGAQLSIDPANELEISEISLFLGEFRCRSLVATMWAIHPQSLVR